MGRVRAPGWKFGTTGSFDLATRSNLGAQRRSAPAATRIAAPGPTLDHDRPRRTTGADQRKAELVPHAQFVTDLGDQAVLLPLAIGVALLFGLTGWRRGAIAWTAAIGGTLSLMLALKLGFLACDHHLPDHLRSPSGHTAAAASIYGGLLALTMRRVTGHERWTLACTVTIAVVIGVSRLMLGVHSELEVVIGGLVGVCGGLAAVMLAGTPPPSLRLRSILAITLFVLVLFHGFHLPAEAAIKTTALELWPLSACR